MLSERIVTEYGGNYSAYNRGESGHLAKENDNYKKSLFKSNSQASGLT